MNKDEYLQKFKLKQVNHESFGTVCVAKVPGKLLFVMPDVASILEYKKQTVPVRIICKHNISDFMEAHSINKDNQLLHNSNMYQYICSSTLAKDTEDQAKQKSDTESSLDVGYVYVIDDLCSNKRKIGKSKNPEKRIRSICNGSGLCDVQSFISNKLDHCSDLERKLHTEFSASRIRGEWFKASFDEIVASLKKYDRPMPEYNDSEYKALLDVNPNQFSGMVKNIRFNGSTDKYVMQLC